MSELTLPGTEVPTQTKAPPRRPRIRRALRILLIIVACLLGLLILVPTAAYLWLISSSGSEFLRRKVVETANQALVGRVEIDHVSVAGLLRLELDGVRLYAPDEKSPVVSLDRFFVDVRATALLAKRVEVPELDLNHPKLRLVQEGKTTNLARALAPRKPSPPKPKTTSKPPDIAIFAPEIHLTDGTVQMTGGAQPISVDHLKLDGNVHGKIEDLSVLLRLSAHAVQPVERSAELDVNAHYGGTDAQVQALVLKTGDSHLKLSGAGQLDGSAAELRLDELLLAAKDVNELAPKAHLLGNVALAGKAALKGRDAQATLLLTLPAGKVVLDADANLNPLDITGDVLKYKATLDVVGVEPQKIVQGLPGALLKGHLAAEGAGLPPNNTATVKLDVNGSRYEGLSIEKVKLDAHVKGMGATIRELVVKAANVDLSASGEVDAKQAALKLQLDAPSLEVTRDALMRGLKLSLPEMAGAVHLTGEMHGPYKAPQLKLNADVPSLIVGANRVDHLSADIDLSRLQPLPQGSFDVSLDRVLAGTNEGKNLRLKGSIDGHQLSVDASGTYKETPVQLTVRGTRQPKTRGEERWVLSTLNAAALGLNVESMRPATIAFGGGHASVEGLALNGGALGQITVDGHGGKTGPVQAHVSIRGLNVDELPPEILPKTVEVGGLVDLDAKVRGTAHEPIADLGLAVTKGRYKTLGPVAIHSDVHYENKHVEAYLKTGFNQGTIELSAKAPAISPKLALAPGTAPAPLDVDLVFNHLALSNFESLQPKPQPLGGTLDGKLHLGGTMQVPTLTSSLQLKNFQGYGVSHLDTALDASYEKENASLHLTVTRPNSVGLDLTAGTKVAIRPVLEGKPLDVKKLPVEAKLVLKELNLAWVSSLMPNPSPLAGALAGQITVGGTVATPKLDGTFQATHVSAAGYHDVNAMLDVKAVEDIQLNAEAGIGGTQIAQLHFAAKEPLVRLAELTPAERFRVPFELTARVGRIPLSRLRPPPPPGTSAPPYDADVEVSLAAGGSADNPAAHLNIGVQELRVPNLKTPIGSFNADLDYRDAKTTLKAAFESPQAGTLTIQGLMQGAIGASVFQANPKAYNDFIVQDFGVVAKHFDLALLNGFSQTITGIGGTLDLNIGPTSGPFAVKDAITNIKGNFGLNDTQATVVEFGSFSGITLQAEGSGAEKRFFVTNFRGKSGEGGFEMPKEVNGKPGIYLEVQPDGTMASSFALDLKRFPVVQSYQTRAIVSLQIRTEAGSANTVPIDIDPKAHEITIDRLTLSHGQVEIPSTIPKAVQPLGDNPDVVIVTSKKSEEKHEEEQAAAAQAQPWVFTINNVVIPDNYCDNPKNQHCGPLVIDAPLDNRIVLSTDPTKSFEVTYDPRLASKGGATQVVGDIQVEGTINLLKSRFELDPFQAGSKSEIRFVEGQPVTDPQLAIKAHFETDVQRVDVTITGTAHDPQKKFDTNPPMADDNEVYYFLATGQRQTRPQQGDTTGAQAQLVDAGLSALGSAAVGVVKDAVQNLLPPQAKLDELDISPDVAGGGIGHVRAGKRYFGGKLMIAGQYNPTANPLLNENTYEIRSNYRIDQDDYLQGLAGTAGHYELKFLRQQDFCTGRQKQAGLCSTCTDADALEGKCCTPAQRRGGLCLCGPGKKPNQCMQRRCTKETQPAAECACTPQDLAAGRCVLRPQ